ncbi:hypothetical protein N8146_01295 [Ascidiaceihabitans sp.]|nr:hypothetical protein [Ascidiaceihabitans sp.]
MDWPDCFGRGHKCLALAGRLFDPLGKVKVKRYFGVSVLIFVSPLAASAVVSLWLGFKMRMILFGAWLSAFMAWLVLLLPSAFEEVALTQPGLYMLGIFAVFHIASFALDMLVVRARNAGNEA